MSHLAQYEQQAPNGERHGRIKVVANSVKDDGFAHMTPENKVKAEKLRKEESRRVKARYINHQGPHERLTKPYMRWAGDPIETWHLIPGEVYELPMGFINEINSSGMPVRSDLLDAKGVPTVREGQKIQIHQLIPVSF